MENQSLFDQLVNTTQAFIQIVEEETTHLKNHKLDHALALLPQKKECASLHQDLVQNVTAIQDLKSIPKDDLTVLKEGLDQLAKALTENERALKIVHAVHEGLVTEVTKVICEVKAPVCQYTKNRRQTSRKLPVSMAVMNKTV